MVRPPGCRCPRSPPGTRPPAGNPHQEPSLEGPGWAPHQRGAAPVRQHEGPAPGRAGDRLHGRELVGNAGGVVWPGRADHQLRGEALPRLERPSSDGAARRRSRRRRPSNCRRRPASPISGWRSPPGPGSSIDGTPATAGRRLVAEPGFVAHALTLNLDQERPTTVEKIAALYTSRDRAISESLLQARQRRTGSGWLRRSGGTARGRLGHAVEPLRHPAGQRQRVGRDGPAPAHLPPAANRLAEFDRSGRGCPGARMARRGLPRPRLLGRDVHLPVPELPAAVAGQRPAQLPPRTPRRGPRGGERGRVPGRDVPLAERQRRARGDPATAPEPRIPAAGCPTTPISSGTSTSRWPTTCGSTTWSPAASSTCASPARRC